MTNTTFGGVLLPNASKIDATPSILMNESTLLSGKRFIQTNTNLGFSSKFRCFGTYAQYQAIRALIGISGSLVTNQETFTKCYISGLSVQESDNPSWFHFSVEFKQDTT
ncbi:MAG: hypothetical protein WCX48_08075 [Bacteroidales bacterium]|jgi:hypothetical protein